MAKLTATTNPGLLLFGTLAILGTSIFFVLIPVLLGNAVDEAIGLTRDGADSGAARSALLDAAIVIIGVSVLRGIFAY
ncbi:MAG TPA: hypothetical protein EYQ82_03475, partial [Dehalococcoidia bacterium]|nr:hypothetical protein [Dehalococcoidia bacterium]